MHRPELTPEMEQRNAAETDPTARGGNAAAPAAQGRQAAAAAPTAKPDRPAQPVRPAPAFLTPPRHEPTTCQTDRIPSEPNSRPGSG